MKRILWENRDDGVTRDLVKKVAADVTAALVRVIDIAPPPYLPVFIAAVAATLAGMTMELYRLGKEEPPREGPPPEMMILTALIAARMASRSNDSAIDDAYADVQALVAAGRIKEPMAGD